MLSKKTHNFEKWFCFVVPVLLFPLNFHNFVLYPSLKAASD